MLHASHPREQLSIGVVYLLYPNGPEYKKDKPIEALKRLLAGISGQKRIVLVDNSLTDSNFAREAGPNEFEISGDNLYREFSGWQKGIEYLKRQGPDPAVWLLVNDTFLTQSRLQRLAFTSDAIVCASMRNAIVGKRMTLPTGAEVCGNALVPYVRTHLFHFSSQIIERLGSLSSLDGKMIDRLFLTEFDPAIPLFRKDAPISAATRQLILSHLTKDWYRSKPYSAEHFQDLRGKAISLLNSFLLSLRIHQLGYPLIAYTKAGTYLERKFTFDQIRQEWLSGSQALPLPELKQRKGFSSQPQSLYQQIPPRRRPLSMSSLLELLESRPGREHM